MLRNRLIRIIFILIGALLLSSCRNHPIEGELDAPLELNWNRFREIRSENLRLAFIELETDSRCPTDANCLVTGNAEILLRVLKDGRRLEDLIVTVSSKNPTPSYVVGDYLIQVIGLEPADPTTKKAQYQLTIEVSRSD